MVVIRPVSLEILDDDSFVPDKERVRQLQFHSLGQNSIVLPSQQPAQFQDLKSTGDQASEADEEYPKSWKLALLVIGLCLAALPYITNEFHSFANFGWYGSAYLLTSSALQPTFGRLFHLFNLKWTFVASLAIFEVGSIVCATAPTSNVLIVGRAITGIGSAGLLSGAFVVVAHSVPLEKRPMYTAGIGTFYSLGSIAGPLLGGVFTSEVNWRWCFWLNLPVGGFTFFSMLFFHPRKLGDKHDLTPKQRMTQLDVGGSILLLGSAIMFFLALEYVDQGVPWSDATIIGLMAGSAATITAFGCWQFWRGEKALIPPSVSCRRTVLFACSNAFFLYSTLLVHIYYLSIWFQTVKSRNALRAGVDLLAYIIPCALATLIGGIVTTKTGYFAPPAWAGCGVATIGAGLLVTLDPHEPTGNWIGYFIVAGFGVGLAVQQDFTAVQTVLPFEHVPIGTAAITFSQTLGGAVFVYVGNTILIEELREDKISGVDVLKVVSAGATAFEQMVPPASQATLRLSYSHALRDVFIAGAVMAGLAFLTSLGLEMRTVKGDGSPMRRTKDGPEKVHGECGSKG